MEVKNFVDGMASPGFPSLLFVWSVAEVVFGGSLWSKVQVFIALSLFPSFLHSHLKCNLHLCFWRVVEVEVGVEFTGGGSK